jgi:hypothetical protein
MLYFFYYIWGFNQDFGCIDRLFSDVMQTKGKQKASSLSAVSEQAIEWCNSASEVGDNPSAMETAPIVPGDVAEDAGYDR